MAYLYKHIRKDTNEVFYIGISNDSDYSRAKNGNQRNNLWNKVASKHGWYYEIIEDNIHWKTACKLEKQLIKEYGKLCDGTGILANLVDGGEINFGYTHSDESKKKMSIAKSKPRKPHSSETKNKIKEKRKLQVYSEESKLKMSESSKRVMKSEKRRNINRMAQSDKTLYKFEKDGVVVEKTRIQMVDEFALSTSGLYKLIHGQIKSHKNWKLLKN